MIRKFNDCLFLTPRDETGDTIWRGKFLPQNRDVFGTISGSGTMSLYKYEYPSQRNRILEDQTEVGFLGSVVKLNDTHMGNRPLSGFDWSPDKPGLGLCTSFDEKIRILDVPNISLV